MAVEAPFYNEDAPNTFGVLSRIVGILESVVNQYDGYVEFHQYAPRTVKKTVGAKVVSKDPVANKDNVRIAVRDNCGVVGVLQTPLEQLSEHAIDALAVAHHLKKARFLC